MNRENYFEKFPIRFKIIQMLDSYLEDILERKLYKDKKVLKKVFMKAKSFKKIVSKGIIKTYY